MTVDDRWQNRLRSARQKRDLRIENARHEFTTVVMGAYKAGLSLGDIRLGTGLSVVTIREMIKKAGLPNDPPDED